MARVLELYDHPPVDGRVICADEFGPLNLQPRPGRGWFPARHPARLRAKYNRAGGMRHMFAAPDLATRQMFYRFRDRKRWREFLTFLKQIRVRYPAGKLYIVSDNYGPHKKAEVADWCQANQVELVFTPSNASWLNCATFLLRAPPKLPAGHPNRGLGTDSRTIPRMPDRPPPAPQHDAPS